jgi:hypothetical protein
VIAFSMAFGRFGSDAATIGTAVAGFIVSSKREAA